MRFYLEERFRCRVVATCQKVQYGVLDLASSYCCFSDIAFNNKILMSFSFFLLFSRCAEMLDIAHDYHLLTLDCSSVCDGAASLTGSLTGSRVSRVPLPMSPVTAAAPSPPASPRPVRPRPAAAGPPRPHHRTTGTACHCFSAGWRREETTAGIW